MKRTALIFIAILSVLELCGAQTTQRREFRRFTVGVEWGYAASFHSGIHHNFFSEEGYRVDLINNSLGFKGNGEVYIHCGYNLKSHLNLSLQAGVAGISDFHKAIPVSLRITRYIDITNSADKWLLFADAGSGICLKTDPQSILTGKLGGGYSFVLSPDTKINLLLSYRMTLTHPDIIYDGYHIQMDRINRNNAYISALSLSISLNF